MANKHNRQHLRARKGIVLILSLILMSTIMASTIAISVSISRTLDQSRNLDSFIVASLASDSGIERGLAAVTASRAGNRTFTQALTATQVGTAASLGNANSNFTVSGVESVDDFTIQELKKDQVATFDILKTSQAPANRLVVQAECLGAGCTSILEVTWVLIDITGDTSFSNRVLLTNGVGLSYTGGGNNIPLQDVRSSDSNTPVQFPSGNIFGYRVRLRAVNGDLQNVRATPCGSSSVTPNVGCPVGQERPLLGRVVLTSIGQAGPASQRSQSTKQAAIFWQPQAAGLLNYVLFSEESIIP